MDRAQVKAIIAGNLMSALMTRPGLLYQPHIDEALKLAEQILVTAENQEASKTASTPSS